MSDFLKKLSRDPFAPIDGASIVSVDELGNGYDYRGTLIAPKFEAPQQSWGEAALGVLTAPQRLGGAVYDSLTPYQFPHLTSTPMNRAGAGQPITGGSGDGGWQVPPIIGEGVNALTAVGDAYTQGMSEDEMRDRALGMASMMFAGGGPAMALERSLPQAGVSLGDRLMAKYLNWRYPEERSPAPGTSSETLAWRHGADLNTNDILQRYSPKDDASRNVSRVQDTLKQFSDAEIARADFLDKLAQDMFGTDLLLLTKEQTQQLANAADGISKSTKKGKFDVLDGGLYSNASKEGAVPAIVASQADSLPMGQASIRAYHGMDGPVLGGAFDGPSFWATDRPATASRYAEGLHRGPKFEATAPNVLPVDMAGKIYDATGLENKIGIFDIARQNARESGADIIKYIGGNYEAINRGTVRSATTGETLFSNASKEGAVPGIASALGKSEPAIEQVWGPKFDILMGQQYRMADAGSDLSTMYDILSAKLSKASGIGPDMRAAMEAKRAEILNDMGPEGRRAAGIPDAPLQGVLAANSDSRPALLASALGQEEGYAGGGRVRSWTGSNEAWNSLTPFQKAAAMALMEADAANIDDARNALGAMVNRAKRDGVDIGEHVSKPIYQPTIEPAQERRLGRIMSMPQFSDLTGWAERRWSGQEPDNVQGATHFLAPERTMVALTAREPNKYRSWPKWTGYNPETGSYKNVVLRDGSHAFVAPEGTYSAPGKDQGSINGGYGVPPTGYAGVAGDVVTADAGHEVKPEYEAAPTPVRPLPTPTSSYAVASSEAPASTADAKPSFDFMKLASLFSEPEPAPAPQVQLMPIQAFQTQGTPIEATTPYRSTFAHGGQVRGLPDGSEPIHAGPLHSTVPGRTDHLPITVAAGSFVLPADIVSSLGEGNTNAGMETVSKMFPLPPVRRADGGRVPIAAAGGEFVIAPETVAALGNGDLDAGHELLDQFVRRARAQNIQRLRALPGPEK